MKASTRFRCADRILAGGLVIAGGDLENAVGCKLTFRLERNHLPNHRYINVSIQTRFAPSTFSFASPGGIIPTEPSSWLVFMSAEVHQPSLFRKVMCLAGFRIVVIGWRVNHYENCCIADFYCAACKVVIELDGAQHFTPEGLVADAERTAFLEELGLRVVRFSNADVLENLDGVGLRLFEVLKVFGSDEIKSQ